MGVIWGLPNWVWLVMSGIALVVFLAVARAFTIVFASIRDLIDSLELSQRMMASALEQTRAEVEKMQDGLTRLSARGTDGAEEPAWKD